MGIEKIQTPSKGIIFWPIGNGDSSTIIIDSEHIIQVDLHHMTSSEDEEEYSYPIVEHLVEILPEVDGIPYLSTFVLTHADEDHIKGFSKLLEEVSIGELWFSPKIFTEEDDDLPKDAIAFKAEAERRIKAICKAPNNIESKDRIRIVGYDGILAEEIFDNFPEELISYPGESLCRIDGEDLSEDFSAFIHSPFKGQETQERNDFSLGMQITLFEPDNELKILLFGDLKYEGIRSIFDVTIENDNEDKLEWNVLLAPHHCSKSVMYVKDKNGNKVLKKDIMDSFDSAALEPGYIVASSKPIPGKNIPGDNPPHAIAKSRYEEIVPTKFLCTHENPVDNTKPIAFEVNEDGIELMNSASDNLESEGAKALAVLIDEARGNDKPPKSTAGFGC